MNVTLPLPLQEYIRHKVEGGTFPSADAVVCQGLLLLQCQDEWTSEARLKIEVGWAQAEAGQLLSPETVQEDLAQRKALWKSTQK